MHIEFEQRYRLEDETRLRAFLKAKGATSEVPVRQVDTYFNAPHRDFLRSEVITEWLRVRMEGHHASVTLKKWSDIDTAVPHCDELETMVGDGNTITDLLLQLGFVKIVTVDKLREVWRLDGGVRVCIDNVTALGSFVEFEAIATSSASDALTNCLQKIATECAELLGDRDSRGYAYHFLNR